MTIVLAIETSTPACSVALNLGEQSDLKVFGRASLPYSTCYVDD